MHEPKTASEPVSVGNIAQALRVPPCASKVIPLLKRHLSDPNASLARIIELIRLDPGVSACVLQAANSALFKRGERCHSVELAVNRIGFDHIFDIVASAVAEQVLLCKLQAYSMEADEYWRRSVACGIAAEHLAGLRDENIHVAYTLGLLHAVGMAAIDRWAQTHAPTLAFLGRGFPRGFIESERALLGFTNAEVGAAVLRAWDFPGEMAEPVRWQYAPVDGGLYRKLNCLLYASRWLAARVCASPGEKVAPPEDRLLAPLRFNAVSLEKESKAVAEKLETLLRSLEEQQPEPPSSALG